jgi:hypothetical protein
MPTDGGDSSELHQLLLSVAKFREKKENSTAQA